jgi:hypothetical protein
MVEEYSTHCTEENSYNILVRIPKGKRGLGRPKHRRRDNTEMDIKGTELEGVDCMHVICRIKTSGDAMNLALI